VELAQTNPVFSKLFGVVASGLSDDFEVHESGDSAGDSSELFSGEDADILKEGSKAKLGSQESLDSTKGNCCLNQAGC